MLESSADTILVGTSYISTYDGGDQYVYFGGTASGAVVSSGGLELVSSGGSAVGTTVSSGGELYVSSGAFTSDITVLSGGSLDLFGAAPGGAIAESG